VSGPLGLSYDWNTIVWKKNIFLPNFLYLECYTLFWAQNFTEALWAHDTHMLKVSSFLNALSLRYSFFKTLNTKSCDQTHVFSVTTHQIELIFLLQVGAMMVHMYSKFDHIWAMDNRDMMTKTIFQVRCRKFERVAREIYCVQTYVVG